MKDSSGLYRLVAVDRETGHRTRPIESGLDALPREKAVELATESMINKSLPYYYDMEQAYQQPTLF